MVFLGARSHLNVRLREVHVLAMVSIEFVHGEAPILFQAEYHDVFPQWEHPRIGVMIHKGLKVFKGVELGVVEVDGFIQD